MYIRFKVNHLLALHVGTWLSHEEKHPKNRHLTYSVVEWPPMWPLEDNGSKRADSICDMSDMCVFLGEYHISYIVGIVLVHLLADAERAFYVSIKETKDKVKPYATF